MALQHSADSIKWTPHVEVSKYNPDTIRALTDQLGFEPTHEELQHVTPDEVVFADGNILVTTGLTRITNLIVGTASTPAFTATQGFCGVGDRNGDVATAVTAADTALTATTNKFYKIVDAQPTVSAGVISASTTYQSAEANFAWNEWCWGIATGTLTAGTTPPGTSPVVLNHKVQALGTKASGAVWTLQATVTLS